MHHTHTRRPSIGYEPPLPATHSNKMEIETQSNTTPCRKRTDGRASWNAWIPGTNKLVLLLHREILPLAEQRSRHPTTTCIFNLKPLNNAPSVAFGTVHAQPTILHAIMRSSSYHHIRKNHRQTSLSSIINITIIINQKQCIVVAEVW